MTDDLRIDEVEKEVKKLKTDVVNFTELKNTINDLKNTVMDIRALMNETQNPFNLLRFVTDEDEFKRLIRARQLIGKKFSAMDKPETASGGKIERQAAGLQPKAAAAEAEAVGKDVGFVVESRVEDKGIGEMKIPESPVEKGEEIMQTVQPETSVEDKEGRKQDVSARTREAAVRDLRKGISIIYWVYRMLDLGFDERSIRKICDYCEFFCYMPQGYSEHVSNLVSAIVGAKSRKISAEEFILSIYGAAEALGVNIEPKDLRGLIIRVLEKSKADECDKCGRIQS